jgi:hypothetical protein
LIPRINRVDEICCLHREGLVVILNGILRVVEAFASPRQSANAMAAHLELQELIEHYQDEVRGLDAPSA